MYTHNIFLIGIYFIKEGVKGMSLTSPQNSLAYGSMEDSALRLFCFPLLWRHMSLACGDLSVCFWGEKLDRGTAQDCCDSSLTPWVPLRFIMNPRVPEYTLRTPTLECTQECGAWGMGPEAPMSEWTKVATFSYLMSYIIGPWCNLADCTHLSSRSTAATGPILNPPDNEAVMCP